MKEKILYIVVPCYNEEEVLKETTKRLKEKLSNLIKRKKSSKNSRVMYVNDGSSDNTWNIIKETNITISPELLPIYEALLNCQ